MRDAQTKHLAAFAELDEHNKHHGRTEKLVEIGAATREELEMATSKLKTAESEVANLRQQLLLLGLSAQRVGALRSTSQVSSEVSSLAPTSGTVTSRTINSGEVIGANKEVRLGPESIGYYPVLEGLSVGDRVVKNEARAAITLTESIHCGVYFGLFQVAEPNPHALTFILYQLRS